MIRDAVPADLAALRDVYRRASLSNEDDRENLLARDEQVPTAEELGAEFERFLAEQHRGENDS